METIDRKQLQKMQEEQEDLVVVDVMGSDSYKEFHLPGAINVPVEDGFDERIQEAVPDKETPVVVYCADEACQASPTAAKEMEKLGYTNVYDYQAGKKDWQEAGLSLVAGPSPGS